MNLFIIFLLPFTCGFLFNFEPVRQPITIKNLIKGIEHSDFEQIYFSPDMRSVIATEADDVQFTTSISPLITEKLVEISLKNDVDPVFLMPEASFFSLLPNIIPAIIAFSFLRIVSIMSSFMDEDSDASRIMNINKKNIKIEKNITVQFSDWAGSQEVLEECTEFVSYLSNSSYYKQLGVKMPRGILLDGPPGTGKTLLAKAIANESSSTFFSTSGSEFMEMFVGVGAMRIRRLFEDARDAAPSIIFIDEIDAIGKQRGRGNMMGNDESEQTLNQLLTEMDGFQNNENITVIAATNRADILDSALLRPGRFSRIIKIPLPDLASREAIIQLYLKNKPIDSTVNVNNLAKLTAGFSGAQLSNLVNEAAIIAARNSENVIRGQFLDDALEKLLIGIKKRTDNRDENTKRRIAIHEIGHAFIVQQFPDYFDLQKISIQPTYSGTGGYTVFTEKESIGEYRLYTKDFLLKRLMVAMGGKAAEAVYYGDEFISVGASMDLKQANQLAKEMVEKYGMGNTLQVFSKEDGYGKTYSDMTYKSVDDESLELINMAYNKTVSLLIENKHIVDIAVDSLLKTTVMTPEKFSTIIHHSCDEIECKCNL